MIALQVSPKIESLYGLGRQATKLYGFVWNITAFGRHPFGQFSGLKTLKLGWVAFHLITFPLEC